MNYPGYVGMSGVASRVRNIGWFVIPQCFFSKKTLIVDLNSLRPFYPTRFLYSINKVAGLSTGPGNFGAWFSSVVKKSEDGNGTIDFEELCILEIKMSGARPRADLIVSWQGHRVRCWSVGVVKICWQHWENCGRNLRIGMR